MTFRNDQLKIGIAAILFAVFLLVVAIPYGVTSPSNVGNVILSPVFWPNVLSGALALTGVGMVFMSWRPSSSDDNEVKQDVISGAWIRLGLMALLLVCYVWMIPYVGMVWASIPAFIATAALIRTSKPKTTCIVAIIAPLVLYAFFAHVAGVSIPQGEFLRLP